MNRIYHLLSPLCLLKATECLDDEAKCSQLCRARLDHLKSYSSGEQTDGMKTAWRQVRVDRMLVDHFLRAGYYTSACKLSESSGITVRGGRGRGEKR